MRLVVHLHQHQQGVLDIGGRGHRLLHQRGPGGGGQQQPGAQQRQQDRRRRGRQQALEGVQPVPRDAQRPPALQTAQEGAGEEERREEQEHVHAAGDPAEPDVVDRHQTERDGTQPVQLGPEDRAGARGRLLAAGCVGPAGALLRAVVAARDRAAGGPGVLGLLLAVLLDRALQPVLERGVLRDLRTAQPVLEPAARAQRGLDRVLEPGGGRLGRGGRARTASARRGPPGLLG